MPGPAFIRNFIRVRADLVARVLGVGADTFGNASYHQPVLLELG